MAQITHYLAHDPVGNTESYLTEFDSEIITRAAASGIVFIAVYDDGTREIVDGKDVIKPQLDDEPFTLVTPVYVDDRTDATVACFDALAAIVDPSVAAAAEGGSAEVQADPVKAFMAALEKLRALKAGGDA
nr:MAG TPA: hypothetical protein [Bacteriophage sp.]